MMAFVVYEAVCILLYVVFISVVVGELGGKFLGGIVVYCTLHYSRVPWRPPKTALTSPLLSVRVFQRVGGRNSPGVPMLSSPPASQLIQLWQPFFYICSLHFPNTRV